MSLEIPLNTRLRPKASVLVREIDGEAVLLDVESGRYFGLNATGVRIWALLAEGEELGRIIERLAGEFAPTSETTDASPTIRSDLLELCAALEREGLVERVG